MKELTLADFKAGDLVSYVPYHANGDRAHPDVEHGEVTSTNHKYVFVKFRPGATNQACLPDQLVFQVAR